ncbi:MAG: hypothetical protein JJE30_17030 [Desulfuromonadales bacterium]|nr:hypothetical protein [Desulfuromonadales bacterium]
MVSEIGDFLWNTPWFSKDLNRLPGDLRGLDQDMFHDTTHRRQTLSLPPQIITL